MAEQRGAVRSGKGTDETQERAVDDALEVANGSVGVDTEEAAGIDDVEETGEDLAAPAPRRTPPPAATLKSRRAFARRQWRRRWLAWRHVLVLLLVILLLIGGIWAVYFSSWLQVKGQSVHGELKMTSAAEVAKYAAVPKGTPLATADLKAVRVRILNGLPVVGAVDVSREWPDKVRIDVTERTPVAVVAIGGRLRALDATGAVFWNYPKAPAGLPRVTTVTGAHSDALREAARVIAALPSDLAGRVDHVEVRTVDSISLALHGGKQVLWGSSDQSATKAKVLVALMSAKPKVDAYDVSVPGQPVTGK